MDTTLVAGSVKGVGVLDKVIATVDPVPEGTTRVAIEEKLAQYDQVLRQLLPMESSTMPAIQQKQLELKQLQTRLKYPMLSLDVLKWRNRQGFPLLALFNAHSSTFTISSQRGTNLPEGLASMYDDVRETLRYSIPVTLFNLGIIIGAIAMLGGLLWGVGTFIWGTSGWIALGMFFGGAIELKVLGTFQGESEISAQYQGLLPSKVRAKIRDCSSDFETIYIMAEVPQWKRKAVAKPRVDPLVVGYKDGALYLVDKFDATPLENYVSQEFATNPGRLSAGR